VSKLQEDKGLPSHLTRRLNKQRLEGQAIKGWFADSEIAVLYHQVCRALSEQQDNVLKTGTSTTQWHLRQFHFSFNKRIAELSVHCIRKQEVLKRFDVYGEDGRDIVLITVWLNAHFITLFYQNLLETRWTSQLLAPTLRTLSDLTFKNIS